MPEELPTWLQEDDAPQEPSRRAVTSRRALFLLAAVPWIVVLGLVASGTVPPDDHGPASGRPQPASENGDLDEVMPDHLDADEGAEGPVHDHEEDPSPPEPVEGPAVGAGAVGGSPGSAARRREETTGRVGVVALLVARAWLTDVGPRLEVDGVEATTDLYLEHAAVESVDRHGEHAVVTVVGVVLERDGDVYGDALPVRLAVPIALGDDPQPAGTPWRLPAPSLESSEPDTTPTDDPDELVALAEAVASIGLAEAEVLGAARTEDGWWLVDVADADTDEPAVVWVPADTGGDETAGGARRTAPGATQTSEHEEQP